MRMGRLTESSLFCRAVLHCGLRCLTTKIILLDTKHGTNHFGLKLGCFVALDSNGVTRVLAAYVSSYNKTEIPLNGHFRSLQEHFGCNSNIAFTDGDIAMAEAMISWPGTFHLYCTFHIWKNFFTNIHPLSVNKSVQVACSCQKVVDAV